MTEARRPRPVVLCILDGWGWREEQADNAVALGRTPNFDRLWAGEPHAFLKTSGEDVGLPAGQMGNSEVGHMNIGAGRVVFQDLPMIDRAIRLGEFGKNQVLKSLVDALKDSGGTCHVMGLLSPGGVHAHQDHMVALVKALTGAGIPVAVHAFLDGRDTPPQSAHDYLKRFQADLEGTPDWKLATVSGRYYAMDRDKRWDRVQLAYKAIVEAEGQRAKSPAKAIDAAYEADKTDEFVHPTVVGDYAGMKDGDAVLMSNFRADRAREILTALVDPDFSGFERPRRMRFSAAVGMVEYSKELNRFLPAVFPPKQLDNVYGKVVSDRGLRQLRMAETEKYPHVTFFLNGGVEEVYPGEDRIMIPSPKVATYDLQPEMSAYELTDRLVEAIDGGTYDTIVVNYANPDMVGHTGSLKAAIKAVETVDECLGRVEQAVRRQGGAMIVTADHGNCEMMRDPETGGPHTAHTTLPVPVILLGGPSDAKLRHGRLADLAPTLLQLMGVPQPREMDGRSLLLGETADRAAE